jgi:uncharacterized protein YdeI (BOF family)
MKKFLFSFVLMIATLLQYASTNAQVFPGSTIVDPSDNAVMSNWIGSNPGGTLLYRRSTNGASASTFHSLCDNQGPTVVLIKTVNNTVFGGYASESWGNYNNYSPANGSFLFNLSTDQRVEKGGYYGINNPYGIYSVGNYGPTFGSGHDLYIESNMNGGFVNIGNSYNYFINSSDYAQQIAAFVGPGLGSNNSFGSNFIAEIEVYKITLNYSSPIILGRNIKRYIDNSGVVNITATMIDSASYDPDGIASVTIDKTSFDCSNVGAGTAIPINYIGSKNQDTRSYGGGYNPNNNQFNFPQWADPYVYVYDNNGNYVSSYFTNQYQMMQLWMNYGSSDIFTANWGYASYSRISNGNTVWSNYTGATAGAITSDGVNVYAKDHYSNFIRVLDINSGNSIRTINLPGYMYNFGTMVVANNFIYIAGYANGFSSINYTYAAIHVFDMNGNYISSTSTLVEPYAMAFDGETMWISNTNYQIHGYKISDGNAYLSSGAAGTSVRLTVTDLLGNSAYKDYKVQLLDTILPSISLNGNTIEVAPYGGPWNDPLVTATDNCPKPVTVTGTVDVNTKGIYQLSYQMKDAGSNLSNSVNRTVYVGAYDITPPVAIARNLTLNLATGSGTITANQVDSGSYDVNGLKSISIDRETFTCTDLGAQTVKLFVEDFYGFKDTATAIVNVTFKPSYTIVQNGTCVDANEGTAEIVPASGAGNDGIYALTTDYFGSVRLVKFDNQGNNVTTIGATGTGLLTAMAVNSQGQIIASDGYSFYQIDKTTGYANYLGYNYYCSAISGMFYNSQDELVVWDNCGYMYKYNPNTNSMYDFMYFGYYLTSIQQDPTTGEIYGSSDYELYKIDINNNSINYFTSTPSYSIKEIFFNSNGDLFYIDNYYGTSSQLYSVNKQNGLSTFVNNISTDVFTAVTTGGGLTYTWSNGQSGLQATNLSAGTYTVTISGTQGCSTVDTVVIQACTPILPEITVQVSDSIICTNGSSTLTANATTATNGNQSSNATVNDPNLVAYYQFNETSGTNVDDKTNNNLNGSFAGNGSSFWTNSSAFTGANGALGVGGQGNYVNVPDNNIFNSMQSAFTIEAWIKTNDNVNNTIVDRANYNFLFQANPHGQSGLGFYNPNIGWIYDFTNIPTSQWTHVAVSWNASTSTLKFYVNGNETSSHTIGTNLYFNSGNMNIGRQDPNGCQCNFMDGAIDELRIWKSTRTSTEIMNNKNSVIGGTPVAITHTYSWSPASGLNTTSGATVIATPNVTTTYTVTATNSNGVSNSTTQTIEVKTLASNVVSVAGPTNVCPGNTVSMTADQNGTFTYQWYNGGVLIPSANSASFTASVSGVYTVEISSAANCSVTSLPVNVVIGDSENPVAIAQNISRTITSASGTITILASDINNGSTDNCSIANISISGNTSFDCNTATGVYPVVLTITDAAGNSASASATVSITNACNTAPVAICKSITVAAQGQTATVSAAAFNNGSSDAENDALSFSVSPSAPYAIGTTNVVLTVTDPAGLSSSCNASITVNDSTAPIVIVKPVTLSLDANGTATLSVSDVNDGSSDNIGITSLTLSNTTFNCSTIGTNTVTLTAEDAAGNSSTANATVTVVDAIAPNAIAQNISIQLDVNGTASIVATDVNNGSSDNCGAVNISIDKTTFDCTNVGVNTVVLTVTDASGNSSTANAIVTVVDAIAPSAIAQNISLQLDANGTASIAAADVNNGSSDNCGAVNISIDKTTFDCTNVGVNTVVLTVTDASGNSSTANATVTVVDAIAPNAIAQNINLQLDANGTASIAAADVNNGSSDNCGAVNISIDKTTFDCTNVGVNTVVLTVTDASGNTSTANATVTVVDAIAPNAIAQNINLQLDANGTASIAAADVNNGSSDNCGAVNISIDKTTFDCTNVGVNTVVLTVTDASGNSSTANATVTVVDAIAPSAIAQNISIQLNANGTASIAATDVNNGSTDNCGAVNISIDKTTFDCTNVGVNTVVLTVTDASGNSSTANAIVTVVDAIAPSAIAQNISLQLDANGTASIAAADVNNGSSDNCGAVNISIDKTTFDCTNVGVNTVVLTVTDASGNTSTANAIVTVVDAIAPNAIAQNINLQLDANGTASIAAADVNNGSSDNCGAINISIDKTTFDCTNVGVNTVVLTVTDASGNSSTANATVTVVDAIAPVINAVVDQSKCIEPSGTYTIENVTATDNCSITSSSYVITGATNRFGNGLDASGAFNLGLSTITWSVSDASNNTTTFSSTVTINALPTVSIVNSGNNPFCNEITLTANTNGAAIANYMWSNGATTESITLDATDADGLYTVYVVDINGCNNAVAASYNYQKQNLANTYTILAYDEVELHENNSVQSGSIGIMSIRGEAEFKKNVSVTGPGSFVKSPRIKTSGTVNIPNRITGVANVTLPPNYNNNASTRYLPSYTVNQNVTKVLNGNYKEVCIKKGAIVTLNGTIYGKIIIEEGARVTITASIVNIEELKVGKGKSNAITKLNFAGNTSLLIEDKVRIEENCIVNDMNHVVTFYFGNASGCGDNDEDKFSVEGGNTSVVANVMIPQGKIKAKSSSNNAVYMTGLFVADKVKSDGKNIYWNNFSCSVSNSNKVTELSEEAPVVLEENMFNLVAFPNPTLEVFSYKLETLNEEKVSFRLFDVQGRLIAELLDANPNETYKAGEQLAPGVYMLEATQGTERKVLRVVKTQ